MEYNPRKILDNKYILKKQIGAGTQGEVYLALKIGDNQNNEYVVKLSKKKNSSEDEEEQRNFMYEIEILKKLSNTEKKYVPQLYDYGNGYLKTEGSNEDESDLVKRLYLVIDYAEKGDLFLYLKKAPTGLKELHAKYLFKKILEGIQYCHKANICHLDIKIGNILLDGNFDPIITDFGYSQLIKDSNNNILKKRGIVGTPPYICPQIWYNETYNGIDADIFSLGVVLFNLVTGNYGFDTSHKKDKNYKYIFNKYFNSYWKDITEQLPCIEKISKEFKELYIKMVSYNPEKRPSIDNILNDPWMMEINKMNEEELDNLHKNIMEEFIELEVKKNSDNEVIEANKNTAYTDKDIGDGSRGESPEQYFDESLKLKKIKKGEKFANHYLKINELLPAKFMNVLVEKIRQKYEDCKIEVSEKKFAFVAKFDIEQDFEEMEEFEEKNNLCNIKIKLYEDEEGGYFINFIKKQGLIEDYYEFFTEIKAIIKKLLE